MLAALTPGMFGTYGKPLSPRFGMYSGQMRGGGGFIIHNAGWYNVAGEKLGFGDLGVMDFKTLRRRLRPKELFIALNEHDSFTCFITGHGLVGSSCTVSPAEAAPGSDYVAEHCRFIVRAGELIWVREPYEDSKEFRCLIKGLAFRLISRAEAQHMIQRFVADLQQS